METEQPEPQSTMDIAEQIVSQGESDISVSEQVSGAENTPPDLPPQQETPAPTPAEISAAAKFLQSQGHKIHKDDGKPNWLPAPTVEKMLARFYEQESAGWNTRYTGLETEHKTLKEKAENYIALVELAERDPDAFLQLAAQHDDRYKRYIQPSTPQPAVNDDPEPQPPKDANGQPIYTAEWLEKARAWDRRESVRQAEAKLEAKERELQAKQAKEQTATQKRQQILEAVQAKPEFGKFAADGVLTPFQQGVYDVFKANPGMTLMEAYHEYKDTQRARAEGDTREKLVQDINAAPTSTSVSRSAGVVPPASAGKRRSTEDIAREIVSRSE